MSDDRKNLKWIIGAAIGLVGAGAVYWFNQPDASEDLEEALVQASAGIDRVQSPFPDSQEDDVSGGTGWEDEDDDAGPGPGLPVELSIDDAQQILRNRHLLTQLPGSTQTKGISTDPFIRQLVREAKQLQRKHKFDVKETTAENLKLGELSPPEQKSLAAAAEANLMRIALNFESAALESSLTEVAKSDGEIRALHAKIEGIVGSGRLPTDPMAMIDKKRIAAAVDGLKVMRRSAASRAAVLGIEYDGVVDVLDRTLTRLQNVVDSVEYREFHETKSELFKDITKKKWDTVAADFTASAGDFIRREIAKLEADTGFKVLQQGNVSTRGPPSGSIDAQFMRAVLEYDTNPRRSIRAQSSMLSLGEELMSFEAIRAISSENYAEPLPRVVTLLDEATLRECKVIAQNVLASANDLPEDSVFPERKSHFESVLDSVRHELKRRADGGAPVNYAAADSLSDVVNRHSAPDKLTKRSQARLVSLVSTQFTDANTVPLKLREDIRVIQAGNLEAYASRLEAAAKQYQRASNKLSKSSAAEPEALNANRKVRARLTGATQEFAEMVDAAAAYAETPKAIQQHKQRLSAMFSFGGGDPPDPTAPTVPTEPRRPSGGGGRAVWSEDLLRVAKANLTTGVSPRFERNMYFLEAGLNELQVMLEAQDTLVAKVDVAPPKYATERGRRIYEPSKIVLTSLGEPKWTGISPKLDTPRLRERFQDWEGRFKEVKVGERIQRRPYDFRTEVKNPKTFKAVGGGIHFGEVATENSIPANLFSLKYWNNELFFVDGEGKKYLVDAAQGMDPITIKALYRFASADAGKRNAAISIGWGTERQSDQERRLEREEGAGDAILLDPYFVDTPVGQDLILTDSIPWRFDEKNLPNGTEIGFHSRFGEAQEAYFAERRKTLGPIFENIEALTKNNRPEWMAMLESTQAIGKAKKVFLRRTFLSNVQSIVPSATANTAAEDYRKWSKDRILQNSNIPNDQGLNFEQKSELNRLVKNGLQELVTSINDEFDKQVTPLTDSDEPENEALLPSVNFLMNNLLQGGRCPTKVVRFWGEALLAKSLDSPELGLTASMLPDLLLSRVASTTLAMLYDEHVELVVEGESVALVTQMKYRYATTAFSLNAEDVVVGHDADPDQDVETIDSLTTIANTHLADVSDLYPPLQRTSRQAAVAALFRWANQQVEDDELLLDLSELAGVPSRDSTRFPTPDEFIK